MNIDVFQAADSTDVVKNCYEHHLGRLLYRKTDCSSFCNV